MTGHLGFLDDKFPWLIFIVFLCWCPEIWVCGNNRSRYRSLGLSYLSGNFIPELPTVVCICRKCWLSVAPLLNCLVGMLKSEFLLMLKTGRCGRQEDMILAIHKRHSQEK